MRRCKKSYHRSGLTTRVLNVIKNSRSLEVSVYAYGHNHRRHHIKIDYKYKNKKYVWNLPNFRRPGKILRNKKYHTPLYKLERSNIKLNEFYFLKSTTAIWNSSRSKWQKINREINSLHPDYVENNLQPHWWAL